MKKFISIVAIMALVLMLGVASVNAATISADPTTANVGDTVTVTVKADKAYNGIEGKIAYDADSFEFVSATSDLGTPVANAVNGVVTFTVSDASKTADSIVLTFKALKEVTDAKFTISGETFFEGIEEATETVTDKTATVTVEAAAAEETPAEETPATETETDTTKTGTDGNEITKLPQTGSELYVVAGVALVALAGVALVVAKRK